MNFRDSLKVTLENKNNNKDFKQKIADEAIGAIAKIQTEDKDENIQKLDYMINLNKILENYDLVKELLDNELKARKKIKKKLAICKKEKDDERNI